MMMNRNPTSLAKITRPNFTGVLPRQRLFSLLDRGRDFSIIWLTGPPGSGKTTLVSNYVDNRKLDCLWYQVDQGETDIATFFYYMRQAALKGMPTNESTLPLYGGASSIVDYTSRYIHDLINRFTSKTNNSDNKNSLHNDETKKLLPKFAPEYTGDIATFTKSYFRHLFGHLKIPFVVVLDSYNEVPAHSEFHEIIRYGLSEIPQGGCVIFISRSEAPAAMARFRASQNMQLISWDELRLTRHESDSIVKLRGLDLSEDALLQLYDKTQGWAAGLVLMLEHFRTEGKMSRLPETFTPQVIYDYLAGEIFQKLDKQTKEFLLQTACVPQMTAAMSEEITGYSSANSLLDELSRNNNFVTARQILDKTVYQYHPLFREFLLSISKDTLKDKDSDKQYHKIAALLEANDQVEDAVEYLVEAEAWDQLAEIIQKHASGMLENGRGETLAQWLEDLPEDISDKNPWVIYWLASCRFPFALRESRRLYEQAYNLFKNQKKEDTTGLMLACAGVMNAILHEQDDLSLLDQWIEKLNKLLHDNTDPLSKDIEARVTSCLFMAMALRQPDNHDIEYWVDRAYSASLECSNPNQRMSVQLFVAISFMWAGYFLKAKEIINSMKKLKMSSDISPLTLIMLSNVESMYFMLIGNRDKCLKAMHRGLKIAQTSGITLWNYQLIINGIGGSLGSGDTDTANQLLKEIEAEQDKGRRQEKCLFHYFSAWHAILCNDKMHAYQHQKNAVRLSIEVGSPFFETLCRLAMAQILFELGDKRKGAIYLRKTHHTARDIKNHLLEFVSFLSYAYIAIDHGRRRSGLNSLQYAMQLGREYGYKHTLWWRQDVMAELCAVALQEGIETEYVHNLIRECCLLPQPSLVTVEQWPWLFKIYTLGQYKLLKDDGSIGFVAKLQRKPMELLKAIIAFGGDDVSEENLAKTLWPGVDIDYSYRSLTTTIHRLRKLLGADNAIIVQDGRISLDKKYCWLDTWAFDKTVNETDSLLKSAGNSVDAEKIMGLTNKILQLYHGPFMAKENEHHWFVSPREQLRNKFLRCMSDIAHIWEERGNLDKAVVCYQKSLEADNLAEGFYRRLMLCYRKLGRQAEAIEVYERCRKTFISVLKVEPSTETTAIYENIMHDI